MIDLSSERQQVILSALLHDIGKFLHKSNGFVEDSFKSSDEYFKYKSYKHPFVSAFFVDILEKSNIIKNSDITKQLVRCHHESHFHKDTGMHVDDISDLRVRTLAYLVSSADSFSSKERRKEQEKDANYKEKLLDNIFSHVSLEKNKSEIQKHQYKTLDFDNIFTNSDIKNANINSQFNLIQDFFALLKILEKASDFNVFFTNLLFILQKYLTFVPSDTTKEISDISLYDHLKATAALALASYDYHVYHDSLDIKSVSNKDEHKFILVSGTIEGIQKYIYSIESDTSAAKKLRAKSFYLSIFTDVMAHRLLDELNLTEANLLLSAGSKFTLVAPNIPYITDKIKSIKNELEKYMYENFSAELFLNLDYCPCTGTETINFNETLKSINDRLEVNKFNRFSNLIIENPIFQEQLNYGNLCPECKKNHIPKSMKDSSCEHCSKEKKIGELIPKIRYIAIGKGTVNDDQSINFFSDTPYFCYLAKNIDEIRNITAKLIVVYDLENESQIEALVPNYKRYFGNYVAKETQKDRLVIKSFEDIAKCSTGVNNLGVLKMDVDNLGAIFYQGLIPNKAEDINYTSVSRVSTMSRLFEIFFAGYISDYFKNTKLYSPLKNKPEIVADLSNNYIVYAGGDDLLIIGPWNEIIYTAKFIKDKFTEFTSFNKDLTISGGISLGKSGTPVRYLVSMADEALEQSKNAGKNALTVFGKTISWDDFDEVFEFAEFFYDSFETKNTSDNKSNTKGYYNQSFAYRLLEYTNMMEDYVDNESIESLMYISKFSYDIERNLIEKIAKDMKNSQGKSLKPTIKEDRELIFKHPQIAKLVEIFNNEETGGIPDVGDFGYEYMRVILNYAIRKNREIGGV